MRSLFFAAALLATVAGCATPPGVGRRDAQGNPVLSRLPPEELARAARAAPVPLTRDAIVRMSQYTPPELVIRQYVESGTRLPLTPEQGAEMRGQGVDPLVVDFILAAEVEAQRVDRITAQADRESAARAAWDRSWYHSGWYGAYGWPRVYPYGGYAWYPRGSGWYGGVGIGF